MGMSAKERAARLAPESPAAPPPPVETSVEPLACPTCGAPVPLGPGDVATCGSCKTVVPLPEAYRALRAAVQEHTGDRDRAEALYRSLGKPPSAALRAWAAAAELAGGTLFAIIAAILWISAALALLAGFALELVLHALAPLLGIDLIDRFGGGTVYMGFVIGAVALGLFPKWLVGYLDASAEIRRTLQANLAARPPERPGYPSTCRVCGAALEVAPGALGVRCAYCQADNLVALPAEWVGSVAATQAQFHRSIVDASDRARALRAEARAGLPRWALGSAIVAIVFGGIGKCSVWLDRERTIATFAQSMGPPRVMSANIDPSETLPIDTDLAPPDLSPYTVALHRHEVLELTSTDGAWCVTVSVGNTTTFPFIERHDDVAWEPQTDGTYAAHYRAPYTGLFEITIDGLDHGTRYDHLRWRIGEHSTPGLPPPPPITTGPAAPPPPPASAVATSPDGHRTATIEDDRFSVEEVDDAGKLTRWNGRVCDPDGVTALAFVAPHAIASGDAHGVIKVWSSDTGMELYRVPGALPGAVTALARSPDGTTLVAGYAGGARAFTVARPDAWGR